MVVSPVGNLIEWLPNFEYPFSEKVTIAPPDVETSVKNVLSVWLSLSPVVPLVIKFPESITTSKLYPVAGALDGTSSIPFPSPMFGIRLSFLMLSSSTYTFPPKSVLRYPVANDPVSGVFEYLTPLDILKIWEGGMSFHGGLVGVILAILWCARRYGLKVLAVGDEVALVAPLGLFFGRLANFINGELYGRVTDHPLGLVFPGGGPLPRHPSQLYEAGLEGLVLFCVVWALRRWQLAKQLGHGLILSCFLAGYGLARFGIELVREPDAHIGLLATGVFSIGLTMGQLLCLPMIITGLLGFVWCSRQRLT